MDWVYGTRLSTVLGTVDDVTSTNLRRDVVQIERYRTIAHLCRSTFQPSICPISFASAVATLA